MLKCHEARPSLWLLFAASLMERSLATLSSLGSKQTSTSSDSKPLAQSASALLNQSRKVLYTCCSAFAADASLAASWVFLEMSLAPAIEKALSLVETAGAEDSDVQAAVREFSELCKGWPVLAARNSEAALSMCDAQKGFPCLPLEGSGVKPLALQVAVAAAEKNFAEISASRLERTQKDAEEGVSDGGISRFKRERLEAAQNFLLEESGRRAEAASFDSPLQTSQQWASLYLALVIEAALQGTSSAKAQRRVWTLFETRREQTAFASASDVKAAASAAVGQGEGEEVSSACCALCCDCGLEMGLAWRGSQLATAFKGGSASGAESQLRRRRSRDRLGLCAASLAARGEEFFLGFLAQLLVALENDRRCSAESEKGEEEKDQQDEESEPSVLPEALRWMLGRFPGNALFLKLYARVRKTAV